MHRKREKEGGRMQCFMKKEEKSLIDVNMLRLLISTTVLSSLHWPSFLLQFCLIHLSLASLAFCELTSHSSLVCSLFYPAIDMIFTAC